MHEPTNIDDSSLRPCKGQGKLVLGFLAYNLAFCILLDTTQFKLGVGLLIAGVIWFLIGHIQRYFVTRAFDAQQSKQSLGDSTVKQTVSAALLVLGLSFSFFPAAYAAESMTPTEQIRDVDNLLKGWNKVKNGKPLTEAQAKDNARIKERIITQDFDLGELSKLALGDNWKKLNEAQRRDFVATFTKLLLNNAILHSEKYNGTESIEYLSEDPIPEFKGRVLVRSKITVPEEAVDFDVQYAMIFDSAKKRWRIYDLILDEESLMQNYHDQFAQLIKKHSYSYLVEKMKKKLGEKKSDATAQAPAKVAEKKPAEASNN